ncbi:hypothetical protein [Dactylosporangium sp. NPDC005555]|uniref:hypothetical protein n=1 Tax=Dactylosporangium sp. NPDC005555 TaxID=3154889 RepID=UPI0033A2F4AA
MSIFDVTGTVAALALRTGVGHGSPPPAVHHRPSPIAGRIEPSHPDLTRCG